MLSIPTEPVKIATGALTIDGMLWLPEAPLGVVLFAGGNRNSRVKPRHDYVASMLRSACMGTLWLDLLPPRERDEEAIDIDLLTERLAAACDWLRAQEPTRDLPLGLFGASHGAAAVLQVAALLGRDVAAVVLRSGRPDLAAHGVLAQISAPTLLLVGGLDDRVIDTNRAAYAALRCKKRFEIVPGATHLFEEPGSLEVVARMSRGWFLQHTDAVPR